MHSTPLLVLQSALYFAPGTVSSFLPPPTAAAADAAAVAVVTAAATTTTFAAVVAAATTGFFCLGSLKPAARERCAQSAAPIMAGGV